MNDSKPPVSANSSSMQAIIRASEFCIGIKCNEDKILLVQYLEPCQEVLPQNKLAIEAVKQIKTYLSNPAFKFDLPLETLGTVFQRTVWNQIAKIPCQSTISYGDLAKAINSAPRAVGQACGANPHPLIIPCHRVIAQKGDLGGFSKQRGGFMLDIKAWLLRHERLSYLTK